VCFQNQQYKDVNTFVLKIAQLVFYNAKIST
jgi:hypothetical protein